jgi:hypothetical protein
MVMQNDEGLIGPSDMQDTKIQSKTPKEIRNQILRQKTATSLQNDRLEIHYSRLEGASTEVKTQVGTMPHHPPNNYQRQGILASQHVS